MFRRAGGLGNSNAHLLIRVLWQLNLALVARARRLSFRLRSVTVIEDVGSICLTKPGLKLESKPHCRGGPGRPWSGPCCRSSDEEPSPDLEQQGESWYADRMPRVSICIDVPDLKAATTFYCDALGCSIDKEQASHNTLLVGGTTLHLSLKEGGTDATGTGSCTRTYERHWTPVHLDFDVDDVDAAVVEVKRLGGTVEGLKRGEWGAAAFCADPFGNGFCLLAICS